MLYSEELHSEKGFNIQRKIDGCCTRMIRSRINCQSEVGIAYIVFNNKDQIMHTLNIVSIGMSLLLFWQ